MNNDYIKLNDPLSQQLQQTILRLAPSDATVLITGETGTGKEVIARALHELSPRHHHPFLAVNCGALTPSLAESELFGHEKGAFTGASQRHYGWFEAAEGGTLLLDEVGELSPSLQVKLLRVLQQREVIRVGSYRAIPINVRVIAATHVDLRQAIHSRLFREDLYYRLNVAPIHLQPLRQRPQDITVLAQHFLQRYTQRHGKSGIVFSSEAMNTLMEHSWPGNIRELDNVVNNAVLLCESPEITSTHLPLKPPIKADTSDRPNAFSSFIREQLQRGEPELYQRTLETLISEAFQLSGQNQCQAAEMLGISRNTFRTQLSHLGLIKPRNQSVLALKNSTSPHSPVPERELRIGYQKFGNLGVLKAQRHLEGLFQPLGVTVLWSEFPAGPQLLQALAHGEIDFGTTGEVPPLLAQAENNQLRYIAWEPAAPSSVALMVPNASAIQTLSDLRDKRIAVNKGSNVHYLLLQLLDEAGLTLSDVRLIYTPPKYPLTPSDYLSADAWMMWDPLLSQAEYEGHLRRLENGEGRVNNHQFYLSRHDFIRHSSDLLPVLMGALKTAGKYIDSTRQQAASLLSNEIAIDAPALEMALSRRSHQAHVMDRHIIREQQIIADRFYALGLLPRPINVRQAVWEYK
ncbi:sigma 54-interacting transcriptional regulator [Rosenbergiella epipactidis]|uniref:sigma 54-interacting transcriptional regulator n=1 Tax=Rosenbergiella epipactidis TaxID=1544694 RepID=UPI002026D796|nr:sigma 54-interacting transcriptional regulator [Rosenbergiella epipactidis]MCL9668751.1 sigma 54-interacting transcriptional regulator [Rosenbergiella epipactidis]